MIFIRDSTNRDGWGHFLRGEGCKGDFSGCLRDRVRESRVRETTMKTIIYRFPFNPRMSPLGTVPIFSSLCQSYGSCLPTVYQPEIMWDVFSSSTTCAAHPFLNYLSMKTIIIRLSMKTIIVYISIFSSLSSCNWVALVFFYFARVKNHILVKKCQITDLDVLANNVYPFAHTCTTFENRMEGSQSRPINLQPVIHRRTMA